MGCPSARRRPTHLYKAPVSKIGWFSRARLARLAQAGRRTLRMATSEQRGTIMTPADTDNLTGIARAPSGQGALTGSPPPGSNGGGGDGSPPSAPTEQIAGLSELKGLVLYAAVLAFAALYIYFMVRIFQAKADVQPTFDSALVTAAAALAGVLGSAFALEIGTPTASRDTNPALRVAIDKSERKKERRPWTRQALSLEPPDTESVSWPKTLGIWAYAIVASAVTITYVCNQGETPSTIRGLAVAFGGYVIALVTRAYGLKTKAE